MTGMKGQACRDSLSKSQPASMLYDAVRSPKNVYSKSLGEAHGEAQKKTKQSILNEEVAVRFYSKASIVSSNFIFLLIIPIKYLFLAVAVPLYVIFYVLPRWFYCFLIPRIFAYIKKGISSIINYFISIANKLRLYLKNKIDEKIKTPLIKKWRTLENFFLLFKTKCLQLGNAFQNYKKAHKDFHIRMGQWILKLPKKIKQKLAYFISVKALKFFEQIVPYCEKGFSIAFHPLDLVDRQFFNPFLVLIKKNWKKLFETIREKYQGIRSFLSLTQTKIWGFLSSYGAMTKNYLTDFFKAPLKVLETKRQKLKKATSEKIDFIKKFLKKNRNVMFGFKFLKRLNASHFFIDLFSKAKLKIVLNYSKFLSVFKTIMKPVLTLFRYFTAAAHNLISFFRKKIRWDEGRSSKLGKKILSFFRFLAKIKRENIKKANDLFQKKSTTFAGICERSYQFLDSCELNLRFSAAWCFVIFEYSMHLVKESVESFSMLKFLQDSLYSGSQGLR